MITVIGLDGSPLSPVAAKTIAAASLVIGARRHLAAAGLLTATSPARPATSPDRPAISSARSAISPDFPATSPAPAAGPPPRPAGPAPRPGGPAQPAGPAKPVDGPVIVTLGPLAPALDALAAHDGDAVVLASGDPGFFGIVRALRERGLDCAVWPAVSSVALAFARARLPWDDAVVVSAHGRDLRHAVNVCRAHLKVAVLTAPGQGPAEVGAALAG